MKKTQERRTAFHSLKVRITMLLTLVAISQSLAMVIISLNLYTRNSRAQHILTAQGTARLAAGCIDADKISEYIKSGKSVEGYGETHERLKRIWGNTPDIEYLYVYQIREDGCHTIFDTDEENADFEVDQLVEFDESFLPYLPDLLAGKEIAPIESNDKYGWLLTVYHPIFDSAGACAAYIGVDISMIQLRDYRRAYIAKTVVYFSWIFVVFLLFGLWVSSRYLSKPINQIASSAGEFMSTNGDLAAMEQCVTKIGSLNIRTGDEVENLYHSVHQMEHDVCKNIRELTHVTAEKERISTELNVAAKIQLDALPKGYPAFPGRTDFDLYATMVPAKEVGGDLYDYLLLDDDHLMLVVGDVSGKGVPAALFMMTAKTLIATHAQQGLSPKAVFEATNEQLCKGNETGLFVTCWLGIFTFSTGELRFVNAGHPLPVLYHADAFSYLSEKPNLMLGAMAGLPYTEHTLTLAKGDRLFVYSDGVTEAANSKKELFGEERLLNAMSSTGGMNAPDTLASVQGKIDAFVESAEQFDDITMLQFVWGAVTVPSEKA